MSIRLELSRGIIKKCSVYFCPKRLVFYIIFILLIFSRANAYECSLKDPICVAKLAYEWMINLRYDKLLPLTCKEKIHAIDSGRQHAEQKIEYYKKQGADFYRDLKIDFSNVKYELVNKEENNAVVHIFGSYTICDPFERCKYFEFKRTMVLKKIGDIYHFCGISKAF